MSCCCNFAKKNVLHCLKLHQSRSNRRSEKLEEPNSGEKKKLRHPSKLKITTNWFLSSDFG